MKFNMTFEPPKPGWQHGYLHERPAAAPGMRDAKQRSVKDATCAKLELIVAGTSNEKNYTKNKPPQKEGSRHGS